MNITNNGKSTRTDEQWQSIVQEQVDAIRFGIVQIVVHEGRVVQVERTEKIRLQAGTNDIRR